MVRIRQSGTDFNEGGSNLAGGRNLAQLRSWSFASSINKQSIASVPHYTTILVLKLPRVPICILFLSLRLSVFACFRKTYSFFLQVTSLRK